MDGKLRRLACLRPADLRVTRKGQSETRHWDQQDALPPWSSWQFARTGGYAASRWTLGHRAGDSPQLQGSRRIGHARLLGWGV